jgi:hypothetical protein
MQEKRKEIRLLFQQCETAMQREKDLENKFRDLEMKHGLHPNADKHVTHTSYPNPQGPSIASHTFSNHPQAVANTKAIRRLEMYGSASSDSDTTTTDDEGESLNVKELERCARQIQRLLHRIENAQDGISGGRVVKHSRKRRMYKSYQRFCRKFEQNLGPTQSVPTTSIDDDQRNVLPSHIHAGFRNMAEVPATARNPMPFISNSMQDSITHEIATAVHPHHSNRMQLHDTSVSFVARTSALRPAKRFPHATMSLSKKPSFASFGSHNSQPEGLEERAAAPYGTRSRNRPGRSGINYTENTDEDFDIAAPALTNGNLPDSPLQSSVTAEATQSVTVNLEDRKLGGRPQDYPQPMPNMQSENLHHKQPQPQLMMPDNSFSSSCNSPLVTTECNDVSCPKTRGSSNDSQKTTSSVISTHGPLEDTGVKHDDDSKEESEAEGKEDGHPREEADFELEEAGSDVSNNKNIKVMQPNYCENAESDRSVAAQEDTGVMERIKELHVCESSTDEATKERIYLRKKKRWSSGLFKRTHSQSVDGESSYSDNDPQARRLRRKLRGPGPWDRRGSLIFEDKGFQNTDNIEERKYGRDEILKPGVYSEQSQQYHRTFHNESPTSQEHSVPITVSMNHDKYAEAKREIGVQGGTKCGRPGCGKVFYRQDLFKHHEERQ